MKQELVSKIVVEKEGKAFEFYIPVEASLGNAYDAAYEVFVVIGKNIEERNKKAEGEAEKFNDSEE